MIVFLLYQAAYAGTDPQMACPSPVKVEQFGVTLQEAEEAFQKMNSALFREKHEKIKAEISCLSEPLSRTEVASLYRVMMVDAFTRRDMGAFGGYVNAIADAYPETSIFNGMIQDGHPMKNYADFALEQQQAEKKKIPIAMYNFIYIDGKTELFVPTDRPYLFQEISQQGEAIHTTLVTDGKLPEYTISLKEKYWNIKLQPRMAIVSSVLGGLALGSASVSMYNEQQYWMDNPDYTQADLDGFQRNVNVWSTASLVLGISSAGFLIASGIEGGS